MSDTGPSTPTFRAAEAVFTPLDTALVEPLPLQRGDRVADIGPGAGVVTLLLAERVGPTGRVYAVDSDPEMLREVRESARAAGLADRVRTVEHDLDDGPPRLPEQVSLVWSAACLHHALDWAAAVCGLSDLLVSGGMLALGEGGLPTRCLPWDIGIGRPGLEVRLDAAHNRWFTRWHQGRAGVKPEGRGWPDLLRAAGLEQVTSRSALLDLPAPLDPATRDVVLAEFAARLTRAAQLLDADDAATWLRLLDPTDPAWLGHRTDLALLTAHTVHVGSRP